MIEALVLSVVSFWFIELSHISTETFVRRIFSHPVEFLYALLFLSFIYTFVYLKIGRRVFYRFAGIFTFIFGFANQVTSKINDKYFSVSDMFLAKGKGDIFNLFIPVFMKPLFFCYISLLLLFLFLTFHVHSNTMKESYDRHGIFARIYTRVGIYREFWFRYQPLLKKRQRLVSVALLGLILILPQVSGNDVNFLVSHLMNDMKVVYSYAEPDQVTQLFLGQKRSELEEIKAEHKGADIVVIQSETFFDVSHLQDITIHDDVTKNFRRYQQEGLHGQVFVPVVGGLTCNSEFEFLTGLRIRDIRHMDVPYETMPLNPVPSLAKDFKSVGYETIGIHGYFGQFFRRNDVYPCLGLDTFITLHDFENPKYYGPWLSDEDIFDKVLETLDKDEKDKFIFTVTMQNHGPFSQKSLEDTVQVDGLSQNDEESFTNYVSGLGISDKALETFMEKLRHRQKETIVVFYGDHIIGINHDLVTQDGYFTENEHNRYKTDYFVWSNRGTVSAQEKNLSLLSLGRYVKAQVMPSSYFDTFVWNHFTQEDDYYRSLDEQDREEHTQEHKVYATVVEGLMMKKQQIYDAIYKKRH